MTFTLYDDDAAGNPVGSPFNANVAVANASLPWPSTLAAALFTGDARWLEVAVLCPGDANSSTLRSPQALTAVPMPSPCSPGRHQRHGAGGPVGPGAVLTVHNSATQTFASGVYGLSDSTAGAGLRGYATAASGPNQACLRPLRLDRRRRRRRLRHATSGSAYASTANPSRPPAAAFPATPPPPPAQPTASTANPSRPPAAAFRYVVTTSGPTLASLAAPTPRWPRVGRRALRTTGEELWCPRRLPLERRSRLGGFATGHQRLCRLESHGLFVSLR